MSETPADELVRDVPAQVFEKFLADLGVAGMHPDVIARLRKTLIAERSFSEKALKTAVFAEESIA